MPSIEIANEAQLRDEIEKCCKFYEKFHWGRDVSKQYQAGIPIPPSVVVDVGYLRGFVYEGIKGDNDHPQLYFHSTKHPFPIISTSKDGEGFFVSGGKLRAKKEGWVN